MSSKLIATCGCKDSDSPSRSWVQQRQWYRGDWHTFCHYASCGGWDSLGASCGTGLFGPVHITHAGDERLFIVEQPGRIRIVQQGSVVATPFLDIVSLVQSGGEQGLLSVAFHPAYHLPAVPGFGLFWVNYTNTNGDTVIARYTVARANPQQADPASALTLFVIMQPFSNHNGGLNTFGPVEGPAGQRYLYIGMGDGGGRDPRNNAQRDDTLLGKMLRLDPSLEARPALPFYTIPPDNPMAAAGVPLAPSGQKDCAIPGVLRSIPTSILAMSARTFGKK